MGSQCQCGYVSLSPDADGSAVCGGCGRPIGGGLSLPPGPGTDTVQFVPAVVDPSAVAPTLEPAALQPLPADAQLKGRKKSPPPDVPGYELLSELGRGGMGVVYKAREQALNRVVALKMILAGAHAAENERARFRQEAAAVAALHHPGVVQIFHVGEHAGQPYLVLEYVDGGTLAEKLSGGNLLSAREAAGVLMQLAATMQYAHEMGVIHRDLKPANILLSKDARKGDGSGSGSDTSTASGSALRTPSPTLFKITDFGLAKKIDETIAAGGGTRTGAVMGTPSYISPEQAAGKAASVTTRSDVYSLGAILYEMLTDRPPFKADTPLETVLQVLHDEPVAPSKLRPKLPKDLETICLKCLQKDPARQYASAGELADDLGRFIAGEPIRARPVGALARGLKWVRRHPALAAFAATAVSAVALVVAVLVNANSKLTDANKQKEDEARTARQQTARANDEMEKADQLARERQTALDDLAVEAERNRRSQYALELAQAAGTLDRDSVAALRRLNDTARCPPDLRDFLWRYLRGLCARAGKVHPHRHPVRTVAVSPDGLLVATGDAAGGVRVWNPHTNVVYAWLVGGQPFGPNRQGAAVNAVAFSPDGRAVAAAGADGWVRVWKLDPEFLDAVKVAANLMPDAQAELNRLLPYGSLSRALPPSGAFPAFGQTARALAFSPDGRWLAVAGADRVPTKPGEQVKFTDSAKVWDAGAVLKASDPNRAAVLGGAGGLGEWAAARPGPLKPAREVKQHIGPVLALAFSPDGKTLATGGEDHGVILTPMGGGRAEQLALGGGPVSALAFCPDGKTLAAADNDETPVVVLWDVSGKRPTQKRKLAGHTDAVRGLSFAADGRTLATASADGTVRVWEPDTAAETARLNGHTAGVSAVGWLPDRRTLMSTSDDGTARVWSTTLKTCDSVNLIPADEVKGKLLASALSADGKTLATADGRRAVRLWAVDRLFGGRAAELPVYLPDGLGKDDPDWGLNGLAISDDGMRIAAATADGGRVWDRTSAVGYLGKGLNAAPVRTLLPGKAVYAVRFTPAGDRLIAITADGLKVFDPISGTDITPPGWAAADPMGFDLTITPDGRTVACGGRRGTQPGILFAEGNEVRFSPTDEYPTSVDFSPDGTRLLTAFSTRPARVSAYDPNATTLGRVCETDEPLPVVRFCREGKTLYGIRANREVMLFDAETGVERGKLDGHADRIVGSGMTPKDAALVSVGRDGVAKRWNADPPKADAPRDGRPRPGPGPRLPQPPG